MTVTYSPATNNIMSLKGQICLIGQIISSSPHHKWTFTFPENLPALSASPLTSPKTIKGLGTHPEIHDRGRNGISFFSSSFLKTLQVWLFMTLPFCGRNYIYETLQKHRTPEWQDLRKCLRFRNYPMRADLTVSDVLICLPTGTYDAISQEMQQHILHCTHRSP